MKYTNNFRYISITIFFTKNIKVILYQLASMRCFFDINIYKFALKITFSRLKFYLEENNILSKTYNFMKF